MKHECPISDIVAYLESHPWCPEEEDELRKLLIRMGQEGRIADYRIVPVPMGNIVYVRRLSTEPWMRLVRTSRGKEELTSNVDPDEKMKPRLQPEPQTCDTCHCQDICRVADRVMDILKYVPGLINSDDASPMVREFRQSMGSRCNKYRRMSEDVMSNDWLLKETEHVLTEKEANAHWGGRPPNEFRCAICDVRFQAGDVVRSLYTNNSEDREISGNPIVCADHGCPKEQLKAMARSAASLPLFIRRKMRTKEDG